MEPHAAADPHVFHSVLDIVPAAAWQVVRQDDRITVVLAGASADLADANLLETLHQALAAQGTAPIALEVERVASIPKGVPCTALGCRQW